jgi:hypothetical protein
VLIEVDDLVVSGNSLRIDTARYDLAPGVRAFGIDVSSLGMSSSAAEAGSSDGRTLFVREGATLRPVLTGFQLKAWSWPGRDDPRGPEPHVHTLAIGSHGFADIVVTDSAHREPLDYPLGGIRYTLRYDGSSYDHHGRGGDWGIEPEPVAVAQPASAAH